MKKSWKDKFAYLDNVDQLLGKDINAGKKTNSSGITRLQGDDLSYDVNRLETEFYRISLSPDGRIVSIFDKELNMELLKNTGAGFNEMVYAEMNGISRLSPAKGTGNYDRITTNCHYPVNHDVKIEKTDAGVVLTVYYEIKNAPVKISGKNSILLRPGLKRLEIENTFTKSRNIEKEAAYFAFPFNLQDDFMTHVDMPYDLMKYPDDQLSGSNSDTFAVQNCISLHDQNSNITWLTLDAPLAQIGEIRTNQWGGTDYQPANPTIVSYVLNNIWNTNFPLYQEGEFTFRYHITNDNAFSPSSNYRFAQDTLYPNLSMIQSRVAPQNVIVTGAHIHKGNSCIIRLHEVEGMKGIGRLVWDNVRTAFLVDLCGNRIAELPYHDGAILFPYDQYEIIGIEIL